LILAMLGVNVFTQQVISQKDDIYHSDDCHVPISNTWYNQWQYGDKPGDAMPYVQMISAIETGFLVPASDTRVDSLSDYTICDAGNCTFATYASLAVCSRCVDISDQIQGQDNQTDIVSLPDGSLSLDPSLGWVNITSDTRYPNSSAFNDIGPLIAHYTGLGSGNVPSAPAHATECAM
jgi:hypothetical protein